MARRPNPRTIDRLLRYIPIGITAALTAVCLLGAKRYALDSWEDLLDYTPPSLLAAAFLLLGAYALKSLSVVFPLPVLYVAAGLVFPLWMAWGLNFLGLCICVTLPYWVGRISGREVAESVIRTHKKAEKISEVITGNQVFTAYLLRVLGFLPGDLVSILLGAMGMEYRGYLIGSLLGLLPGMLLQTAMGGYADRPASPVFWALCAAMLALSAASAVLYTRHAGKRPRTDPDRFSGA